MCVLVCVRVCGNPGHSPALLAAGAPQITMHGREICSVRKKSIQS